VSRFCGSGISAVNMAASSIMAGMEDVVVAGGVEMMSYVFGLGVTQAMDSENTHLRARWPQPHQGISADLIATLEGASREELDKLAVESQRRAHVAITEGRFNRSVAPVLDDDGGVILDREEYPRPGTTAEALAALKPSFPAVMDMPVDALGDTSRQFVEQRFPGVQIRHVHHAGNSSGVVDGAAVMLLASPEAAHKHGWKPRARIKAMANAGGDPTLMLNEPGPAARKVLARAGMSTADIDLFEVNEAFAVVAWKFMRDLELDPARCNVNGGAIALGHPIGATGVMLISTLLDELERRDLGTGLITMCTGGGMAPAVIIERF
jgi:acetyl-CoA C-acetyltransferase